MKPQLVSPESPEFKAVRRFLNRLAVAYLMDPLTGDQLKQFTETLLRYGFSAQQWDMVYDRIILGYPRMNQKSCLSFPVLAKIADYANDLRAEIPVPKPEFELLYRDGRAQVKPKKN
jgi:hypothetical protein